MVKKDLQLGSLNSHRVMGISQSYTGSFLTPNNQNSKPDLSMKKQMTVKRSSQLNIKRDTISKNMKMFGNKMQLVDINGSIVSRSPMNHSPIILVETP